MSNAKAFSAVLLCWCAVTVSLAFPSFCRDTYRYSADGTRNPFMALVTADGRIVHPKKQDVPGADTDLSLEGIVYDRHDLSYAVVNGQILRTGDSVGTYQILRIEKDKVIFIREGQPRDVFIKKEEP